VRSCHDDDHYTRQLAYHVLSGVTEIGDIVSSSVIMDVNSGGTTSTATSANG
jgi:hypothetical protein